MSTEKNETPENEPLEAETELDLDAAMPAEDATEAGDDGTGGGDRVAALEAEVAKLKDHLLRTMADMDNVRKRADRDKEQTRKFGIANFAKDLLTAADNLRRALDAAPEATDDLDPAIRNLIVGVEMTERELLNAFDKNGIRKIEPMGEKFDYNFHQAMFEVENTGQEAGTVVQVLQPGYAIEDRILRAAMVGVAKGPAADTPEHLDTTV